MSASTDDGRVFYAQAKKLLSEFDELESVATKTSDAAGGKLRVSCPPALGRMVIAPMVFAYLAANPDTAIDLDLSSRYLDPIEDGVDLAIRIGSQADSTYRARLLAPSLRMLVASPDYLKKHGEPKEPADLTRHQVLVYSYLPHPDVLKLKDRKGRSRQRRHQRAHAHQQFGSADERGDDRARDRLPAAMGGARRRSPPASCGACCPPSSRKARRFMRSMPAGAGCRPASAASWITSRRRCAARSSSQLVIFGMLLVLITLAQRSASTLMSFATSSTLASRVSVPSLLSFS